MKKLLMMGFDKGYHHKLQVLLKVRQINLQRQVLTADKTTKEQLLSVTQLGSKMSHAH